MEEKIIVNWEKKKERRGKGRDYGVQRSIRYTYMHKWEKKKKTSNHQWNKKRGKKPWAKNEANRGIKDCWDHSPTNLWILNGYQPASGRRPKSCLAKWEAVGILVFHMWWASNMWHLILCQGYAMVWNFYKPIRMPTTFFYHINSMSCTKEYLIQMHMNLNGTKFRLLKTAVQNQSIKNKFYFGQKFVS